MQEFLQLHNKETFHPMLAESLTEQQKKEVLDSLVFLKEKRDGTLKGRACSNGRKQKEKTDRKDATSPTVALESVLITTCIDAHER